MSAIGSRSRNLATTSSDTSTNCSAICNTLGNLHVGRDGNEILGTSITCSGSGKVSGQEQRQRLVHLLRHRNIEGRERDGVDVLLHGAPLYPPLRPHHNASLPPASGVIGKYSAAAALGGEVIWPMATSTSWSTTSGTGTSRIGTGTKVSMICSAVCRCTRSCGPGGSKPTPCCVFVVQLEEHHFSSNSRNRRAVRSLADPCRLLSP